MRSCRENNEAHLQTTPQEYVAYYSRSRCHQSLDGNAPEPRSVDHADGSVYAIPHLGGLHHEYRRTACCTHSPIDVPDRIRGLS